MYYAIRRKSDGKFLRFHPDDYFDDLSGAVLFDSLLEAASEVDCEYVGEEDDLSLSCHLRIVDKELEIVAVHISLEPNPIKYVYGSEVIYTHLPVD